MKFGQKFILRRIVVATKCQILRLKCTKIVFGWDSTPDPAGGAYSAPPGSLAGFKGPTSNGRGYRKGAVGKEGGEGRGRGRRGGEGKDGRKGGEGTPVCIFKFSLE